MFVTFRSRWNERLRLLTGLIVSTVLMSGVASVPTIPVIEILATSRTIADDDPVRSPETSLWVWDPVTADCLLPVAALYGVDRVLVWTAPGFSRDARELTRLRALRDASAARGVRMDALSGDPSWVDAPDVAARWAAEVRDSGLFDRLHLDVEPHGRADWTTRGPALRSGMLAMVTAVTGVGLPVDIDIPFWFDRFTVDGERFDRALIRRVAGVTVMAYRDHAAAVLEVAGPVLEAAAEFGIRAWVGINVGETGGDPPSTSYRGSSGTRIRAEMGLITTGAADRPAFAGIAIHHLAALPEAGCART